MAGRLSHRKRIEPTMHEAENELQEVLSEKFSPVARDRLKLRARAYVETLVDQSLDISQGHRADTVSAADVDRASDMMVPWPRRRSFKYLGTLGGALFGAGLSGFTGMMIAGTLVPMVVAASTSLALGGAVLCTVHALKD